MRRRKETAKKKGETSMQDDVTLHSGLVDATASSNVTLNDSNQNSLQEQIEEKTKEFLATLDRMKEESLAKADLYFNTQLLLLPKTLREMPVEFTDKGLKELLDDHSDEDSHTDENVMAAPPSTRRRSKGGNIQFGTCSEKTLSSKTTSRKGTISVDEFKTPMNRVPLSALAAAEKYTVSKPKKTENTGISLKRIMKPNEEALSVYGSPLHVQPNISKPTVSIPLPGGVVMNIEPKKPKGQITVPELDSKTKEQIRLLYEQLNTIL